jgi:Leucine-rich repeat (LRR) protein
VLDLSESPILTRGAKDLAALASLRELSLRATGISDEALPQLANLTQLQSLNVSHNPRLTPEAVSALKRALPNCRIEFANP